MICQWSPLLADWAFIVESSFSETSFTPTLSWTKTTFLRKRQLRPGEFLTSGSLRAHSEEEASGTERDGQGVWQEDLALLFLLQLYWLEPCVDVAALYRLSYAPLRGKHYLRNEVTVFFGRYILSARSLSELSGGNCAQSRPRLYSSRAQPHSVFFSGSGATSGATASSGWSVGRWPGDGWGIGMDPVSCFLFTVGSGSLGCTTCSYCILPQTRQNLPILKKGFLTMTVMVSDHINFAEPWAWYLSF